jgi:hypothetical protein
VSNNPINPTTVALGRLGENHIRAVVAEHWPDSLGPLDIDAAIAEDYEFVEAVGRFQATMKLCNLDEGDATPQ